MRTGLTAAAALALFPLQLIEEQYIMAARFFRPTMQPAASARLFHSPARDCSESRRSGAVFPRVGHVVPAGGKQRQTRIDGNARAGSSATSDVHARTNPTVLFCLRCRRELRAIRENPAGGAPRRLRRELRLRASPFCLDSCAGFGPPGTYALSGPPSRTTPVTRRCCGKQGNPWLHWWRGPCSRRCGGRSGCHCSRSRLPDGHGTTRRPAEARVEDPNLPPWGLGDQLQPAVSTWFS